MTAKVESRPLVKSSEAARAQIEAHVERFRAPFSLRCGAFLIDYIVLTGIVAFSTLIARLLGGGARLAGGTVETMGFMIAVGFTVLNFVLLTAWRGQTLGKWATGLRIEQMDGRDLSIVRALLRHLVGYPLSLLTGGLGFLVAIFNAQGRALHDLIAGTVVVRDLGARRPTPSQKARATRR
ncbi:MAG TPA: RDD family protein [Pyrinomonadaceae bacterium]|nr:RDD family protein [Pyrinomonadaceae bacterium]